MIFESLPTTPTDEELIDTAFSRAARAGRAKSGVEAQESMLLTASNVLSDNLENVVTAWPDFEAIDPFYRELADAIADVDALKQHLSEIGWAARKTKELGREYQGKVRGKSPDAARKIRKQGFARMADVVEEIGDDLTAVGTARDDLKRLPDIRPDEPTLVIAGYPNVGKSSFVNAVTNAENEIAEYPFTTTGIRVGHIEHQRIRYQLVDTPGLLDRPAEERNAIERQAVSAIEHVADGVLVFLDPSGTCGYPIEAQLELRDELVARFDDVPVLTVANKSDLSTDVEADHYMSVTDDDNIDTVLTAAIEALDYRPELPTRDG
ncbi:MAG: NOG1 family protein [Halobacteriales archaeon]